MENIDQFDTSKYWNLEKGKIELYLIKKSPYGNFTENKKYVAEWEEDIVKYRGIHRICHIFEITDDDGKLVHFSDNKNTNPKSVPYLYKYFVTTKKFRAIKLKKLKKIL